MNKTLLEQMKEDCTEYTSARGAHCFRTFAPFEWYALKCAENGLTFKWIRSGLHAEAHGKGFDFEYVEGDVIYAILPEQQPQYITSGRDVFEVVEHIPGGFCVWNIGRNMVDGWIPLCESLTGAPDDYRINPDTLKALKFERAQEVLSVAGYVGGNTIAEHIANMKKYIKKNKNGIADKMRDTLPLWEQLAELQK